jgi:hypothetical protein
LTGFTTRYVGLPVDNLFPGAESEHDVGVSASTSRDPLEPAVASPQARRRSSSTWRDPRLVVGIVIVAVSVLLGARVFGAADDTTGVWALRAGMSSGTSIEAADLVRRDIGFSDSADADRYLPADTGIPAGATLRRDVGAGELLPRAALGHGGQQAAVEVPLSIDSASVSATVGAGSVVDVWVAPAKDVGRSRGSVAELVFDDVTVVSAPPTGGSLGPSATRQVIVGVGPAQEANLPAALAKLSTGTIVVTEQD